MSINSAHNDNRMYTIGGSIPIDGGAAGGSAAVAPISGMAAMAVRQDAVGPLPGVDDGDFSALQVDANGALKIAGSVTAGTIGPGPEAAAQRVTFADEISAEPGDTYAAGDRGVIGITRRQDGEVSAAAADGDLSALITDSTGRLKVTGAISSITGDVAVINGTGGSLTVDDGGTSLTVDGTVDVGTVTTLTSITNDVNIADGGNSITVDDGGASLTVDGTVDVGTVTTLTSITNDVNIADGGNSITVDDGGASLTVDGSVAVSGITGDVAVINGTGGTLTVDDGGTSLTVDGTVDVGTVTTVTAVTSITNDVNIADGGNSITVDDGGASLTVDGSVAVSGITGDVAVINGTGGTLTVDDGGTSLTVDGTVDVGTVTTLTSITNDVNIADGGNSITVDDGGASLTVDGTVDVGTVTTLTSITNDVNIADGGNSITVDDGGASLTVDGSVAVSGITGDVAVINGTGGTLTVDDGGTSLTVDGTVDVGTVTTVTAVTSITNDVNIADGGNSITVDDGGGSLTVDGSVAVSGITGDVAVINGTGGSLTVDDGGTSLTVDGTVDVGTVTTVTSITNDVNIADGGNSITVDDGGTSLTVDGTVDVGTVTTVTAVTSITNDVNIADGGNSITVDDGGGSLTVDGSVAVSGITGDVAVINGTGGSLTVDDGGTSLTVDGTVDVGTVTTLTSITNDVNIADGGNSITVDDGGASLTVDGTVDVGTVTTVTSITNDVNIADGGNSITVDDGGASLTVDGSVAVSGITGDVAVINGTGGSLTVDDGGTSLTVDGTVDVGTVTTLTSITNDVNIADGGNSITVDDGGVSLTVDNTTLSVVGAGAEATAQRVTLAEELSHIEGEAAVTATDRGVEIMARRRDTEGVAGTVADDDYTPLQTDALGRLRTTLPDTTLLEVGDVPAAGNRGIEVLARRQDATGPQTGVVDGDYSGLQTDRLGALKVALNDTDQDARWDQFEQLRVSESDIAFESIFYNTKRTHDWTEDAFGLSTVTYTAGTTPFVDLNYVAGAGVQRATLQTQRSMFAKPGRGMFVVLDMILTTAATHPLEGLTVAGLGGELGIQGGVFFGLLAASNALIVVRVNITVGGDGTAFFTQPGFNIDPLDGTGISGVTLDTTERNSYYIEYPPSGVGEIIMGVIIDGKIIPAHRFQHSNSGAPTPSLKYMSLPIRFDISGTALTSSAALRVFSVSVATPGKATYRDTQHYYKLRTSPRTDVSTTFVPLIAYRVKYGDTTTLDPQIYTSIAPTQLIVDITSTNTPMECVLLRYITPSGTGSPPISPAPTWIDFSTDTGVNLLNGLDSAVEYAVPANGSTLDITTARTYEIVSGATLTNLLNQEIVNRTYSGYNIIRPLTGGPPNFTQPITDIFVVAVRRLTAGTSSVVGGMRWEEIE